MTCSATTIDAPATPAPRVVVLGLGNTILTDDAIGILAAREVAAHVEDEAVAVRELCWGGFSILDVLPGFDWAILIDAIQTPGAAPGTITQWAVPARCPSKRLISYHDMGFFTALEVGRLLGLEMPTRVTLFTVEASDTETIGETMTPAVAAALPRVVEAVIETLARAGALRGAETSAALAGAGI